MSKPVIFISAVSKELRSARTLVARTLDSLGYEAIDQAIAPTETGMLPQVLRDWIDQSDAVIQLVGHHYGFAPKEPDTDFGECSYTQLEALYARQQGKKVWYLILTSEHPTDPCTAEASALRELQDAYRTKVTSTTHLYHRSSSLIETELLVRRIKDELSELRQEELARQNQLQQSIEATLQNTAEILAHFGGLQQQAHRQPSLPINPQTWPPASPFHNRGFSDQHNFVGRETLLSALKQTLDAGRDAALTQHVAMHGAGGIGKTRAAVEFARAHGSAYTLCLFLDAQSPEALRASLVEVARKLELTTDPQASADALVLLSLRLLRAVPTALVVADNADTPAALEAVRLLCHEPGGVRWLITTRLTDLGDDFAAQPVGLLTEVAAVELLQKRARKKGHQPGSGVDACAVAIELGRLPLALQQAAAYVAHMHLNWTAYSKLLADNPAEALSREAKEMKAVPESILRTYRISIQQLKLKPKSRAIELLEIAAHLAHAPIPEGVFLQDDDDNSRRAALAELAALSLLEWQAGKLEIHRAIAIAVRLDIHQDAARRMRLEEACRYVTSFAPEGTQHPDDWPAWAALQPHIEHLLADVGPVGAAAEVYTWLLAALPNYFQAHGEYASAEAFYHRAIALQQHTLGSEHPETLACRNNLANALNSQGKHAEAEREQRAVLRSQGRVQGEEHPHTLGSRNNLAVAMHGQGRHVEAEQEHRAVLRIRDRVQGSEHPDTLTSRNNLANTLHAQGRYIEAEQEHREVLLIKERVLGTEHPSTLMSRMGVANAQRAQGNHVEAENEHRAVLRIQERVLGAEHPEALKSRNNLANALHSQGKHVEAECELQLLLQIKERVLGSEHPSTLGSKSNLANVLNSHGKHAEAEQEHRAVLQVKERVLGVDHPDVAMSCYNLALSLAAQNKLPEGLGFMQRAEQMWTKIFGPDHPRTQAAKAAIERLEAALKQDTEASHPGP